MFEKDKLYKVVLEVKLRNPVSNETTLIAGVKTAKDGLNYNENDVKLDPNGEWTQVETPKIQASRLNPLAFESMEFRLRKRNEDILVKMELLVRSVQYVEV
ncbi:uncharacterized protein A4U43_C04F8900 [Asparagus officinalis]|uniref:Uncharacterized protein n=1 Tax=Asparagus officinalis TaxID=4686 RepID=A0A5P1F479_ASPOF|nr:uncharacterized protein A4U43_C04F8900 [Asparagus officinalis]